MNSSANQQNTANRGGASSVATPANSGTSGLFGGTSLGASHGKDAGSGGKASMDGVRRSSQEGNKFGNLSNLKRNSGDAAASARRTSLNDQGAKPGFIGSMWNKYTKGGE